MYGFLTEKPPTLNADFVTSKRFQKLPFGDRTQLSLRCVGQVKIKWGIFRLFALPEPGPSRPCRFDGESHRG